MQTINGIDFTLYSVCIKICKWSLDLGRKVHFFQEILQYHRKSHLLRDHPFSTYAKFYGNLTGVKNPC